MKLHSASRFWRDRRGNFAVILALVAVPIVGMAGLGLDYSRIMRAEQELQAGLDAALSAAAATGGTSAAMQQTVRDFLLANVDSPRLHVETTVDTHSMHSEASFLLPLPVFAALGKPRILISADGTLFSRAPLRRSGAPVLMSEKDRQEALRRIEKTIAKAPYRFQRSLREQMRRLLERQPSPFYLSQ